MISDGYCVGPQNGEPLCPCHTYSVCLEAGRVVCKHDLGPADEALRREYEEAKKAFHDRRIRHRRSEDAHRRYVRATARILGAGL